MSDPSPTSSPVALDRAAIETSLPHREPFLFLDAAELTGEGESARLTATWRVPPDADWFRGHYPGAPVLPGVLICEHAMQAAALLVARALGALQPEAGLPVVARLEDARFRRMVRPGENLETEVQLVERIGPAWRLKARVRCEGARCVELVCVLSAAAALARATGGEA